MQTLILLCTLAALAGLPAGYGLAWVFETVDALMEAYVQGSEALFAITYCPEVWR
jgi:hypothetical protein